MFPVKPPVGAEQRDLLGEAVRDGHRIAVAPERRVFALSCLVVEDHEVADALDLIDRLLVVLVDVDLREIPAGKHADQLGDAGLDQVDAGRFQRLQEAAGQANRDHVALPEALATTGREAQPVQRPERRTIQVGKQRRLGLGFLDEATAVDVAVAIAVLQRNSPLPAGCTSGRAGVGLGWARPLARNGQSAVTRQPVAPGTVGNPHGLADQQSTKAGAVDEQLAFDAPAIVEFHRFDEAALRMLMHLGDTALDALHPTCLRVAAQKAGVEAGVELEGIGDLRQRRLGDIQRSREAILRRCHAGEGELVDALKATESAQLEEIVMEGNRFDRHAEHAEWMQITVTDSCPVIKADAELEGGLRAANEIVLVDAEQAVEGENLRNGCLAYADRADLLGLHQGDAAVRLPQHL